MLLHGKSLPLCLAVTFSMDSRLASTSCSLNQCHGGRVVRCSLWIRAVSLFCGNWVIILVSLVWMAFVKLPANLVDIQFRFPLGFERPGFPTKAGGVILASY